MKTIIILVILAAAVNSQFLSKTTEQRVLQSTETPTESFEKTHGILLMVAWGLIFDLSLIIVRYGKGKNKNPPFQLLHSMTMWMTYIISTVSIAIMIDKAREENRSISFHGILGFIILGLSSLSMIGGIATVNKVKSTEINADTVEGRGKHGIGGYICYVLTRIELISGCADAGTAWIVVLLIYFAITIVMHIIITVKQRRNKFEYYEIKDTVPRKLTQDQENLINKINQGASRAELLQQFPQIKWAIYGNFIVDLTNWLHPGGNFFIEATLGREVTQFLKGAFTIETKVKGLKPYNHSRRAYEFIETAIIGQIKNTKSCLVDTRGSESYSSFSDTWNFDSKRKVSKSLSQFEFSSSAFSVKSLATEIGAFGRHFTIKFKNQDPTRTYTTALALTPENELMRNTVYNNLISGAPLDFNLLKITNRRSLPLFIKEYNFPNGFSKKIHGANLSSEFLIEGPSGQGIDISSNSKGNYCIICAGTGILPFLDLLNYIFFKSAYEIYQEKGSLKEAEAIKNLGFDFDKSFSGLKLNLIGFFSSIEETHGYDIIAKLAQISKKFKKSEFVAALTQTKGEDYIAIINGRFDANILGRFVSTNSQGYYICGPPNFNVEVPSALNTLGIEKVKVNYI